jgi:hypothetical protein
MADGLAGDRQQLIDAIRPASQHNSPMPIDRLAIGNY